MRAKKRQVNRPESQTLEEAEIQSWATGLTAIESRLRKHFTRSEARERAYAYLKGLLSPIERKNGWQIAEQVGDATPDGIQRLLNSYQWEADAVRDDLGRYVVEHLADPQAVVVLDETGFVKKGRHSVGVQRQYSGTAGRVENCQLGVFLVYSSRKGSAFVDRELYLPRAWVKDAPRCQQAGVPAKVTFATKPALAQRMVNRLYEAGVRPAWVTADEVYGSDRNLRAALANQLQPYVMAVRRNEQVGVAAQGILWSVSVTELLAEEAPEQWERLSAGDGAKGPRIYDWALIALDDEAPTGWSHHLLLRRSITDTDEVALYRVFASEASSLADWVRVAGTRWTIEACFEEAKGQVGLDQYEVRRWRGWYRHITLALLAHAFLVVTRLAAHSLPSGEKKPA